MIKKTSCFVLVLLLCVSFLSVRALAYETTVPAAAANIPDTSDYSVNAKGAVVIEMLSGRVLFAQNANARLPMASTTKIMSALLTLEQPDLDSYFTVDPDAIRVEGSSMGLTEGDSVNLRGLAIGMLLPSGNDAANAAAVKISGSKEQFVDQMNERAAQLGLTDTHFVTPSGLNDDEHFSSAYDMAALARHALQNEDFAAICSQSKVTTEFGNPPFKRWFTNHNRLLTAYEGTVGVKTGFTKKAGRCLVSAAVRDGVGLIAVTLNCPDDWTTHKNLYDRYFAQVQCVDISTSVPEVTLRVAGGQNSTVRAVPFELPMLPLKAGEIEQIRFQVDAPEFLYAPVRQGDVVGSIRGYLGETVVLNVPLTADETIEPLHPYVEKKSLWEKICEIFS